MRAEWNSADLDTAAREGMFFTAKQAEQIQAEVRTRMSPCDLATGTDLPACGQRFMGAFEPAGRGAAISHEHSTNQAAGGSRMKGPPCALAPDAGRSASQARQPFVNHGLSNRIPWRWSTHP